jgi:hypothetical protein
MCLTRRPSLLAIIPFTAKHLFPSRFYVKAEFRQKAGQSICDQCASALKCTPR